MGLAARVLVAACLCLLAGGGDAARIMARRAKLGRRVWRAAQKQPRPQEGAPFRARMEAVNQEHPRFPSPHEAIKVGLAVSGGGGRAMGWAMGVLRALEGLGLMDSVDAISAVSGGCWATAPYMFAAMNATELLGRPTTPEEFTLDVLNSDDGRLKESMSPRVFAAVAYYGLTGPVDEVWEKVVADVYLGPFNLGNRSLYMAGSEHQVSQICAANPQLSPEQFLTPRPDRPRVFIMNGMLTAPPSHHTPYDKLVSIQMSPDYTGSPFWADYNGSLLRINYTSHNPFGSGINNIVRGGGLVETFAMGSQAPSGVQSGSRVVEVAPPLAPFSLAKAVAISSNAVVWAHSTVWPVLPRGVPKEAAIEHGMADGGLLENSGVLALLQRRARKIVSVLASAVPFDSEVDFCAARSEDAWFEICRGCDKVGCTFTALFGYAPDAGSLFSGNFDYRHDQVFERSAMPAVLCELQGLKQAGNSMVSSHTLQVQSNSWWGIEGGFDVEFLVVYLDKDDGFEAKLAADTRDAIRTYSTLRSIPHFGSDTYIPQIQVSILAAQSEYAVRQNADHFRRLLG